MSVREMTATEASRKFSHVLDLAERGETTVITRDGKMVAKVVPSSAGNGALLRQVVARWRGHPALDEEFAANVASAQEVGTDEIDDDPWRG